MSLWGHWSNVFRGQLPTHCPTFFAGLGLVPNPHVRHLRISISVLMPTVRTFIPTFTLIVYFHSHHSDQPHNVSTWTFPLQYHFFRVSYCSHSHPPQFSHCSLICIRSQIPMSISAFMFISSLHTTLISISSHWSSLCVHHCLKASFTLVILCLAIDILEYVFNWRVQQTADLIGLGLSLVYSCDFVPRDWHLGVCIWLTRASRTNCSES